MGEASLVLSYIEAIVWPLLVLTVSLVAARLFARGHSRRPAQPTFRVDVPWITRGGASRLTTALEDSEWLASLAGSPPPNPAVHLQQAVRINPTTYRESARQIRESLQRGRVVILDLAGTDEDIAARLIDFCSATMLATYGALQHCPAQSYSSHRTPTRGSLILATKGKNTDGWHSQPRPGPPNDESRTCTNTNGRADRTTAEAAFAANAELLGLNAEIRKYEHWATVAKRRRRLAKLSYALAPMLLLSLYAMFWLPWLSRATLIAVSIPGALFKTPLDREEEQCASGVERISRYVM